MSLLDGEAGGHVWFRIVLLDVGRAVLLLEEGYDLVDLLLLSDSSKLSAEFLMARTKRYSGIAEDVLVPLRIGARDR